MTPDRLGGDIANPQSLNRYAYALNNPTTLTDPSGLDSCTIDGQPGICITSTDVGPGDPMLEMIWEIDSCLNPISGCPYDYYQQNEGSSSNGGGGVTPAPTLTHPNIVTWPQLKNLVHANNESNLCDDVVDCIVFKESTVHGGFDANALGTPYTYRGVPQQAKGLMQVTQGGTQTVNNVYHLATSWEALYGGLFNPAINITTGTDLLQYDFEAAHGDLRRALNDYGGSSSGAYANDVLNCVKQLQRGNFGLAEAAAHGH